METAFGHLNGYSAVLLQHYMWSTGDSEDLFTEFKKDAMVESKVAAKYRQTVPGASGTKSAATWCATSWAVPTRSTAMRTGSTGNDSLLSPFQPIGRD